MHFIKNVENKYKIATLAGPVIDLKTKRKFSFKEIRKLEKDDKDPIIKLKKLAKITGMEWNFDNVLNYSPDPIIVFANLMTKKEYKEMEDEIKKSKIKGKGYEIYAWNDNSGYEYWKKQGESENTNYIQVSVAVDLKQVDKIEPKQLVKDSKEVFAHLAGFDNSVEHLFKKRHEKP